MTEKQDWQDFINLIRAADEVTAGKPRSETALSLMFFVLLEFEFADVRRAVSSHVRTNKFSVTPADITGFISGTSEERSVVAWRMFLNALNRYGYYNSVRFPGPAYHYVVVQLGGWMRLSEEWHSLTDREIQFRAKEWRQFYEIGLRVATWNGFEVGKTQVPAYLCGFYERNNRQENMPKSIPGVIDVQTGMTIDRNALVSNTKEAVTADDPN